MKNLYQEHFAFPNYSLLLQKCEDKLHLNIKNKQAYFVLLAVCIIFVASKRKE